LKLVRIARRAAAFGCVMCIAFPLNSAFAAQPGILSISTGHSIVLKVSGVTRLAVGDGRIAGVVPVGRSGVLVNGKSAGHTTIFVWQGTQEQVYEVTVTEQSVDEIARILRSAIKETNVQVVTFGTNLFVRGTVADLAAYNDVDAVIARFKGVKFSNSAGADGAIVNAVTVSKPLGNMQDEIGKISAGKGVRADMDADGNVVVSGSVRDQRQQQEVLDRVKTVAGPYLKTDGKIIDRLGMQTSSQVDIKVYVLEVDKTANSSIGLQLGAAQPASVGVPPGGPYIIGPPNFSAIENPAKASNPFNPLNFGAFVRVSLIAPTLNLLLQEGHAKLLSSPNLVTQPGQAATFLVGGEVPIPVSNGLGTVTIDYKEYGVKLNVTPTILGNGSVETKIAPEISEIDFADGIQLNGFAVPAFKTSKLSTDVTTQSGESIIMGGLIRRIEQRTIQKIPLLGDLPILGKLFRSTAYQRNDSDVVFIMTPTIMTK